MTEEKFNEILNNRLEQICTVLGIKAKEYVRNNDRLHNFNKASSITGEIREKVLWNGFALKHLVSVMDMLDDIQKDKIPNTETVDEKIGDLINYLILLECCIKERIQWEEEDKKYFETENNKIPIAL